MISLGKFIESYSERADDSNYYDGLLDAAFAAEVKARS